MCVEPRRLLQTTRERPVCRNPRGDNPDKQCDSQLLLRPHKNPNVRRGPEAGIAADGQLVPRKRRWPGCPAARGQLGQRRRQGREVQMPRVQLRVKGEDRSRNPRNDKGKKGDGNGKTSSLKYESGAGAAKGGKPTAPGQLLEMSQVAWNMYHPTTSHPPDLGQKAEAKPAVYSIGVVSGSAALRKSVKAVGLQRRRGAAAAGCVSGSSTRSTLRPLLRVGSHRHIVPCAAGARAVTPHRAPSPHAARPPGHCARARRTRARPGTPQSRSFKMAAGGWRPHGPRA